MKPIILFISLLTYQFSLLYAQDWEWESLSNLPEAVSNNAVSSATVNGTPYAYSFAGIDTTKSPAGIHLRSYRYNTLADTWESIAPLPDELGGKIAAGASTVKNKIYIIGGYHVASNFSETSSEKVHIYDPETNTYLEDGAPIPVPIDDQVQAVWRDSLIYVVTGWSNSGNVGNVQIYNPALDTWSSATPVTLTDQSANSNQNRVFGGSGCIIGDTIYYAGGAQNGFNFPLSSVFRKGYIHPDNPDSIDWYEIEEPLALGYRMGAEAYEGTAIWLGGSLHSYNFDGIAYVSTTGPVDATNRILTYDPTNGELDETFNLIPFVMDLRGLAKIAPNEFMVIGGMVEDQTVSNQVFKLVDDDYQATSIENRLQHSFNIYPNPINDVLFIETDFNGQGQIMLFNTNGQLVLSSELNSSQQIDLTRLPNGIYQLQLLLDQQAHQQRICINK